MASGFEHILHWRLLSGSHPFPGPDGGTCINEAAVVAAGLPYRSIRSSSDCPPCFSKPLAAYALGLNDAMPDDQRSRLMAFVLRLSGSADTVEIEEQRTRFLALESIRRILPPLLDRAGFADLARSLRRSPGSRGGSFGCAGRCVARWDRSPGRVAAAGLATGSPRLRHRSQRGGSREVGHRCPVSGGDRGGRRTLHRGSMGQRSDHPRPSSRHRTAGAGHRSRSGAGTIGCGAGKRVLSLGRQVRRGR